MSAWRPIGTAPKDGTRVLCWAPGWEPAVLIWKTNQRIVTAHRAGQNLGDLRASYFGDPNEDDDYELASTEYTAGPTHWLPVPKPPSA